MPSNVSGGIFSIVVIIVLVAGCISPQPANQTEQIPAGMENPGTNSAKTVVNGQTSFVVAQGDTFSSTYIDPLRPDTEVNIPRLFRSHRAPMSLSCNTHRAGARHLHGQQILFPGW